EASWKAAVQGNPASLVAADGRLFVITREGQLLCFGATERDAPALLGDYKTTVALAKHAQLRADELLKSAGLHDGYGVLWGAGDGELAIALAEAAKLRWIVVDPSAEKVAKLRAKLARMGIDRER